MDNFIVLYNPLAGNGTAQDKMRELESLMQGDSLYFSNMLDIRDYGAFFNDMPDGASIIICGGDGTLNRFLNDTEDIRPDCDIYYYPSGSGNDCARDIGAERNKPPVLINRYIERLPEICVNGTVHRFINGIGYGIDGYCCLEGDRQRETSSKPVNYTAIAIKGLLFHYKPASATVTVDGVTHTYRHVWLAPVMNGRHYGGGMIPTPQQDRLAQPKQLSVMVYHSPRKLQALMVFPSIFKGEHVKKEKVVEVLTGREIAVEFDAPKPLQIDGETIPEVRAYRAAVSTREC